MKSFFALILAIITLSLCTSCDSNTEGNFPVCISLNKLKESNFNPTLEDSLDNAKNTVYCSTLLFAWDGIKSELTDIHINQQFHNLALLHASQSYKKSLRSDEYSSDVTVAGGTITAVVKFAKSLPFEDEFEAFDKGLDWQGTKVNAFGAKGDFDDVDHQVSILYYESDSNFVVKLHPKDQDHEIILYKTPRSFKTMAEIVQKVKENIELGKLERRQEEHAWKYRLTHKDELLIPTIGFNIEHRYSELEASKFSNGKQGYSISKAYQRTAFVLNNEGAKIESEAEITVATTAAPIEPIKVIPPKLMHFDQAFFVMMKRKDATNPYFGVWMATRELLEQPSQN